jgi:t-SNARE complex subunit (syntaxin)
MIEEGNLNAFNEDLILETKRLRQTLKDVEERHNEFIQIEKKIEEIRDMMNEIFLIVYDQGPKINSIEQDSCSILFILGSWFPVTRNQGWN